MTEFLEDEELFLNATNTEACDIDPDPNLRLAFLSWVYASLAVKKAILLSFENQEQTKLFKNLDLWWFIWVKISWSHLPKPKFPH